MTATVEQSTKTEVQLLGVELARVVGNAALFTSGDATLPVLNAVQLTLDGRTLSACATDRYTLGRDGVTTDEGEGSFAFILRKADAIKLVSAVKAERFIVWLSVDGDKLTVRTLDTSLTFSQEEGTFPSVDRLIVKPDASADAIGRVQLNPAFLAKFAKVKAGRNTPMRMLFNGTKPVYIEIGETFVGLIMAQREV